MCAKFFNSVVLASELYVQMLGKGFKVSFFATKEKYIVSWRIPNESAGLAE